MDTTRKDHGEAARATRDRAGFTITELLVVAVIGIVVLAAVFQTLSIQQRTFTRQSAVITTQGVTRTSVDVLASELREVSASGGGLLTATPDSFTVRALRKFGFVCSLPGSNYVEVWELGHPFRTGDNVVVYDQGDPHDVRDDAWLVAQVSEINGGAKDKTKCLDWPGTTLSGEAGGPLSTRNIRLHLETGGLGKVARGAPIRSFQTLTYGRFTVDGEVVLARRAAGTLQPLIGPLAEGRNGMAIRYFAGDGTEFTGTLSGAERESVSYLKVSVRGRAAAGSLAAGGVHEDDLEVTVFLRNNDPNTTPQY